jgi:hypothetical protein
VGPDDGLDDEPVVAEPASGGVGEAK